MVSLARTTRRRVCGLLRTLTATLLVTPSPARERTVLAVQDELEGCRGLWQSTWCLCGHCVAMRRNTTRSRIRCPVESERGGASKASNPMTTSSSDPAGHHHCRPASCCQATGPDAPRQRATTAPQTPVREFRNSRWLIVTLVIEWNRTMHAALPPHLCSQEGESGYSRVFVVHPTNTRLAALTHAPSEQTHPQTAGTLQGVPPSSVDAGQPCRGVCSNRPSGFGARRPVGGQNC